nr:reverse transcriptase domain-containing protein [Tanacetum cinerariifolium]
MRTRSRSRYCNNSPQREASPAIVEPLRIELPFLKDQFQEDPPPESLMADNQTMAELLQAPTKGYEDAIVIPEITANNFELKHGLINLVQNKQFFRLDKEDPHVHIRHFNKITSTMRVPNVPSSSIKLMLFPFSLEGEALIWLEKEPPRSIQTWDDLVSKFINQFFSPSKITNLHNEITRFQQRFDESFYEAWERFNDLLRACPHHGFFELHQLDTFYNALNVNDQDSLNSAAGVNFLDKMPRECLKIIESKSKVRQSRAKAVVAKSPAPTPSTTPAPVKVVEPNCFFPPSKTTNLRNEITRFQQRFDESFYEAWECFNDLLRACTHHGFSELHQLDTFYNALNVNDQYSLNSAAGGNFLDKMPRECLKIIESKFKVGTSSSTPVISSDVAELKDMVKALLLDKKN